MTTYEHIEAMLAIEYPRALDGDKIATDNCIVLLKMLAENLGLEL